MQPAAQRRSAFPVLTPSRASWQIVKVLTFVLALAWLFVPWKISDQWVAAIIVGSGAVLYCLLWLVIAAALPQHLRFLNDSTKTSSFDSPGPHSFIELFGAWRDPAWRCRNQSHRTPMPSEARLWRDPRAQGLNSTNLSILILAIAAQAAVKAIPILTKPFKISLFVVIAVIALVAVVIKSVRRSEEILLEALAGLTFALLLIATWFIASVM